jgi:hypothetical protein
MCNEIGAVDSRRFAKNPVAKTSVVSRWVTGAPSHRLQQIRARGPLLNGFLINGFLINPDDGRSESDM